MSAAHPGWRARIYRVGLRVLPSPFRDEYGDQMVAVLRARWRAAPTALARAKVAVAAAVDIARNAAPLHADVLGRDLRHAARRLRRAPLFALTAVVVGALGVGVVTAALSVADRVLLRPLPFPDDERLVKLWQDQARRGYPRMEVSPGNYRDHVLRGTSLAGTAAFTSTSVNLVGAGEPERVEGISATLELFAVLGVPPLLGRAFAPADETSSERPLVLAESWWRRRFGADPGILGQRLLLDGAPHVVVGVMPARFAFPTSAAAFWSALSFAPEDFADRGNTYLQVVARLRPGVTLAAARAEVRRVAAGLEREFPQGNRHTSANLWTLRDEGVSQRARLTVIGLVGAALCLLTITCANLASLLLSRALARRKEIEVRRALGAGRARLVRELVTEGALLAALAGAIGAGLAAAATPALAFLVPAQLPLAAGAGRGLDPRFLALAVVLTAATALGFGLVPALRGSGGTELDALRAPRVGSTRRTERLRSLLVTAEVAATVVLLVVAGLFLRALARVQEIDPGFESDGVLTLRTALPPATYGPTEVRQAFYRHVLGELSAIPGVERAAYISHLPMVMRGGIWQAVPEGSSAAPEDARSASMRFVTPGFFEALRVPLLLGRDLADSDTADRPAVAVVSESFVRTHWPEGDALGRRFEMAFAVREVVGVVGDVRVRGLERESEPQVYLPSAQQPDDSFVFYLPKDLVVRSSLPPVSVAEAVRAAVRRADPLLPISDVRTLDDILAAETAPRSAQLRVLAVFALAATALAGLGIHGLLAVVVAGRAKEIGVRRALGANARSVALLVLWRVALLVGVGAGAGALAALWVSRSLQAVLAGVSPADRAVFAGAVLVVVAMAAAGSAVPAWRATRVDPITTLRAD